MRELSGQLLEHIIYNLTYPLDRQEHIGEGKDFWCLDWWAIELGKYFFEGEIDYLRFPIARRLEGNNNFKKDEIAVLGRKKIEAIRGIKKVGDKRNHNEVLVFETCRGLDTLLVLNLRDWKKIYVTIEYKSAAAIESTKGFLKTFPKVEFIDGESFDNGFPMPWMKTAPFVGGFTI